MTHDELGWLLLGMLVGGAATVATFVVMMVRAFRGMH